jgi:hypothetical protein
MLPPLRVLFPSAVPTRSCPSSFLLASRLVLPARPSSSSLSSSSLLLGLRPAVGVVAFVAFGLLLRRFLLRRFLLRRFLLRRFLLRRFLLRRFLLRRFLLRRFLLRRFRRGRHSDCAPLSSSSLLSLLFCWRFLVAVFRLRRDLGNRWPDSPGPLGPFGGAGTGKRPGRRSRLRLS